MCQVRIENPEYRAGVDTLTAVAETAVEPCAMALSRRSYCGNVLTTLQRQVTQLCSLLPATVEHSVYVYSVTQGTGAGTLRLQKRFETRSQTL